MIFQDVSQKYIVAATVCYTDLDKNSINLRYTTQMPNIRGFGPLMALIFCPTMQVKCNKEKTHYTAIRTGLGYDNQKNRPIFEEHDIVFDLDVEITRHDFELVIHLSHNQLLLDIPTGCNLLNDYYFTGESDSVFFGHVTLYLPWRR